MFGQSKQLKQQIHQQHNLIQQQQAVLNVLNRSMAVIEFDLNGNILHANENFLKAMGYTLDEVIGQHHRIFVDKSFAKSAEYKDFWHQLSKGQFLANRYQRLAKDRRVVWIEASYNPILDSNGTVNKIVKFATDVTKNIESELNATGQLDAINRAMAVIEFDLDGNILHANENFLKTMGYSLAEIKGKHHRLFADSDYAQSNEYQLFWKQLAKGEFFSGTFKRLGKGGREVWIEASYNPIFGIDGQPYKIVKYATDVGQNPNMKLLQSVVENAVKLICSISSGNLTTSLQIEAACQESMFYKLIDDLQKALAKMSSTLNQSINTALHVAHAFDSLSTEVMHNSSDLNKRMQQQAAAIEESSATLHEITQTVEANTATSAQVAKMAQNMQQQAKDGAQVMTQTISAMQEISASSSKIADIVTLIDGIAFQTNLLALNAAVEAARAGEHGRGFAVVAGEVRALAQKSAEAAKDIRVLIADSLNRIEKGTGLADKSGQVLTDINGIVTDVTAMIESIAQASIEQTKAVNAVHQAVSEIDRITQENSHLVESTSSSAKHLSEEADNLKQSLGFFKTNQ